MVQFKSEFLKDARCLLRTGIEKECLLDEILFVSVNKAGLRIVHRMVLFTVFLWLKRLVE